MSKKYELTLDEYGFILDSQQWSVEVAKAIAESIGVEGLDAPAVQVLMYLREHYLAHGSVLPEREVCHAVGMKRHCIRKLFGDYEHAWKIAGLPDPGIQLREYMEDAG